MKSAKGIITMIATFLFTTCPVSSKSVYKYKNFTTEFERNETSQNL